MKYRPDIDGIRSIAVLAVIAFHLDETLISGGFVGVDVFFVLSGFLITSIILHKIDQGNFSLKDFYIRRMKRILPALFLMQIVALAIGYYILLPREFANLGKHACGATLSLSNVLSMLEFDYFDSSKFVKPLLHCWSLSLEEQYYVMFPLLLLAFVRYVGREKLVWFIGGLLVASFAANIYCVRPYPTATYYLVFTRMWELLIGSLLACWKAKTKQSETWELVPLWNGLAAIGLTLIVVPNFVFTPETEFPGWAAVLPCLGTALVIEANSRTQTWVGRILSLPVLVGIGQISYSLYLWHWPIIVFWRYLKIFPLGPLDFAGIVVLTFLMAFVSWKFVEQPLRYSRMSWQSVCLSTSMTAAAISCCGAFLFLNRGLPSRIPSDVRELLKVEGEPIADMGWHIHGDHPKYFVWGDSHAGSLLVSAKELFEEHQADYAWFWKPAWLPSVGIRRPGVPTFHEESRNVLNYICETDSIEMVFLVARWAYYTEGTSGQIGPAEEISHGAIFSDEDEKPLRDDAEVYTVFANSLRTTIDKMTRRGKTVVLVYQVPETGFDIARTLAQLRMLDRDYDINSWHTPDSIYHARQDKVLAVFHEFEDIQNVIHVDPAPLWKTPQGYLTAENDRPLYRDSNHISSYGAEKIIQLLRAVIDR